MLPARAYTVFRNASLVQIRVYNGYNKCFPGLYKISCEKPEAVDVEIDEVALLVRNLIRPDQQDLYSILQQTPAATAAAAAAAAAAACNHARGAQPSTGGSPAAAASASGSATAAAPADLTARLIRHCQKARQSLNEQLDASLRAGWQSPGTNSGVASSLATLHLLAQALGSDRLLRLNDE